MAIKASDLYVDDGAIKTAISDLEALKKSYETTLQTITAESKALLEMLNKVSGAREEETEQIDEAAKKAEELAKAQRKYEQSLGETEKELVKVKAAQAEANRINKLTEKLNRSAEGSYDRLSASYSLMKIRLNQLSAAERETTFEGQQLVKQSAEIYEEMKRLQAETGKHTLNVGNYASAWKNAGEKMGELPGIAGAVAAGAATVNRSFLLLVKNPLVLGLAALVTVLGSVFGLFGRTKVASDLMAKSTAYLSGLISVATGIVDKFAKAMIWAFENPKEAVKGLWEVVKTNIVNRFEGLLNLVNALGLGLNSLWRRDLEGAKIAAEAAGRAFIQLNTGLDTEQQKAFGKAISDTTSEINRQAMAFVELEKQRKAVRAGNRQLEKQIADITTKEELLKAVADDATKSFKEREEASQNALQLTIKRAALEKQAASANLGLVNQELDLRTANGEKVDELLDQQLEAYKNLRSAEKEYLLAVRDSQKVQSELKQDRLEKDLDILIDGFDNQKTVNEKIIADETRTFQEREKLLAETRRLFENTFQKQIETIQQFTGVQIDSNDLVNTSDAVLLNQKIRSLGLSEIIEGRLLEIIRERRIANQDLTDSEKALNQEKGQKAAEATAKAIEAEKKRIEEVYQLSLSEIEISKDTEAEKTKLKIQAEIDRNKALLAAQQKGLNNLSENEIKTVQNNIKKLEAELGKIKPAKKDIYSLLGIKLDQEGKQAVAEGVNFAVGQLGALLQAKVDNANRAVEAARSETEAARDALNQEIENKKNGFASNVQLAQRQLTEAKKNEEEALKIREKAAKRQVAIDTALQSVDLISASAKIFKQIGNPLIAIPLIGLMFGAFATAKIQAFKATKEVKLGDGGFEMLEGGSHASGNDIPLMTRKDGTRVKAEGGEGLAVFSRSASRRYRGLLPKIVDSLNKGNFEKQFGGAFGGVSPVYLENENVDLSKIESDVSKIANRKKETVYKDSKGRTVRVYKNLKQTYV